MAKQLLPPCKKSFQIGLPVRMVSNGEQSVRNCGPIRQVVAPAVAESEVVSHNCPASMLNRTQLVDLGKNK